MCRFINTQDKNEAIKTLHEGVAYLLERHQVITNWISNKIKFY